jgi:hypothetical protein
LWYRRSILCDRDRIILIGEAKHAKPDERSGKILIRKKNGARELHTGTRGLFRAIDKGLEEVRLIPSDATNVALSKIL